MNKRVPINTSYFKMGKLVVGFSLIFGFFACKPTKVNEDPQRFNEVKEVVYNKEFKIRFQWAQPQRGGMIDLTSNPNELILNGDQLEIYLPYFGVRHRGGAYNQTKVGINYKGKISELQISEDADRRNIVMEFEATEDSEKMDFILTIFENGKAQLHVTSSDRDSILYQGGEVTSLETE